ncbi:MAG: hypothetical protein ABIQ18_23410 [Umezawaea sp.]
MTIPKRKTVAGFDDAFQAADALRTQVMDERPAHPTDQQWITYYRAMITASTSLVEVYDAAKAVAPGTGIIWSALWEASFRYQGEVSRYRKRLADAEARVAQTAAQDGAE